MGKKKQIKRCSLSGKVINPNDEVILVTKIKDYISKQGYILVKAEQLTKIFLLMLFFMLIFNLSLNSIKAETYVKDPNSFYIDYHNIDNPDWFGVLKGHLKVLEYNINQKNLSLKLNKNLFFDMGAIPPPSGFIYHYHEPSFYILNDTLFSISTKGMYNYSLNKAFYYEYIENYFFNGTFLNYSLFEIEFGEIPPNITYIKESSLYPEIFYKIRTDLSKLGYSSLYLGDLNTTFEIKNKTTNETIATYFLTCNFSYCPSYFLGETENEFYFLGVSGDFIYGESNLSMDIFQYDKNFNLIKKYNYSFFFDSPNGMNIIYSSLIKSDLLIYNDYLYVSHLGGYAIFNKTTTELLKQEDFRHNSNYLVDYFINLFIYNNTLYKIGNYNLTKYNDFLLNDPSLVYEYAPNCNYILEENLKIPVDYCNIYVHWLIYAEPFFNYDKLLINNPSYFIKDNVLYVPLIPNYVSEANLILQGIYLNNFTLKEGHLYFLDYLSIYATPYFNIRPKYILLENYNLTLTSPLNNSIFNYPFNVTFNLSKEGTFNEIYLYIYDNELLDIIPLYDNESITLNFIDYYKQGFKTFNVFLYGITNNYEVITTPNITIYLNETEPYILNITSPLNNSIYETPFINFNYEVLTNEIPFKNVTSYLNGQVLNFSENETFFNFTILLNRSNYLFNFTACNILNECFTSLNFTFEVSPLNYSFEIISPINEFFYNLTESFINFTFNVLTYSTPLKNLTAYLNNQLVVYSENETFFNYSIRLNTDNYTFYLISCNILNECFTSQSINFEVLEYKEPPINYLKIDLNKGFNFILLSLVFILALVFLFLGYNLVSAFIILVLGFVFLFNDTNPIISALFIASSIILIFKDIDRRT